MYKRPRRSHPVRLGDHSHLTCRPWGSNSGWQRWKFSINWTNLTACIWGLHPYLIPQGNNNNNNMHCRAAPVCCWRVVRARHRQLPFYVRYMCTICCVPPNTAHLMVQRPCVQLQPWNLFEIYTHLNRLELDLFTKAEIYRQFCNRFLLSLLSAETYNNYCVRSSVWLFLQTRLDCLSLDFSLIWHACTRINTVNI